LARTIYSNNADTELLDPLDMTASPRRVSVPPDGAVDSITSIYDSIVYLGIELPLTLVYLGKRTRINIILQ